MMLATISLQEGASPLLLTVSTMSEKSADPVLLGTSWDLMVDVLLNNLDAPSTPREFVWSALRPS